jgi:hypothetical protein
MAEKTKAENQQDFKAIIDAGGPRGALAQEVVRVMASYFGRCAALNDLEKSLVSAFAPTRVAAVREHAGELEEIVGRLYRIVRDWNAVDDATDPGEIPGEIPGAEAAR